MQLVLDDLFINKDIGTYEAEITLAHSSDLALSMLNRAGFKIDHKFHTFSITFTDLDDFKRQLEKAVDVIRKADDFEYIEEEITKILYEFSDNKEVRFKGLDDVNGNSTEEA